MKLHRRIVQASAMFLLAAASASPGWSQIRGRSNYNSVLRRPAVSSYNLLFNDATNRSNSVSDYFTLVRPQLRQQAVNQQQSQSLQNLQQEVQDVERSATNPYSRQMIRATGHSAGYMNLGPWYGAMGGSRSGMGGSSSPRRR